MSDNRITFADPELAATFRVDTQKRTISGLAVPWNKVARSGFSKWKFAKDSLYWADESRIKLNLGHDATKTIGKAVRIQSLAKGLDVTFKLADGVEEADTALSLAAQGIWDGFSIEIADPIDGDLVFRDPSDKEVNFVQRIGLRGVALTPVPAFDDARVSSVIMSRESTRNPMPRTSQDNEQDDDQRPADEGEIKRFIEIMVDKFAESDVQRFEQLGKTLTSGIVSALENLEAPQGRQPVKAARFGLNNEPPIYTFNGRGHSLVRDAWAAQKTRDRDALERINKFEEQTRRLADLAYAAQFAAITTGNASEIIPPGYRPDLYQSELVQGRPMVSAVRHGPIGDATPFTVPVFGSSSGVTADHVEGQNPTDGSLALDPRTVTPQGISGLMKVTREMVDSSNPAIDMIVMDTLRESYARQTEAKLYALLNGTDGAGGTITGDNVPSGAQASTVVAALTDDGSQALVKHIRERLAKYGFQRFMSPTRALMGQNATVRLATANDDSGRALLPSLAPQNGVGSANSVTGGYVIDTLPFVPAWAQTGVAAGDSQILIVKESDVWVWESPTLMFRWEERSGPAFIELALFGYFACHILRPVGLSGIRITTS